MNRELGEIIISHSLTYPCMEITDMLKLIYQNEFGGGHLIKEPSLSLLRLKEEIASAEKTADGIYVENIGNNLVRVYLYGFTKLFGDIYLAARVLNGLFVKSSSFIKGDISSYDEKLNTLLYMCKNSRLPEVLTWSKDCYLIKHSIEDNIKKGRPMLSHSERYRELYRPKYRVLLSQFAEYIKIFLMINEKLSQGKPVLLAIDGKCGSGKSTLAGIIADVYNAPVVSMDDFFLPLELRTRERLDSPGGNVHYERFLNEVLKPYDSGGNIEYRPFDCSVMDFSKECRKVEYNNFLIVEGSYSMRPELLAYYDIKIFMDISPEKQMERIIKRNGKDGFINFKNRWIPMENQYFEYYNLARKCDMVL
ncbi:MAG: hypothetical protein LBU94_04345 [Clostridiales bacterium]|jgi:uridine kinase|nr:hypothetical protein [Clostridiales bacterium]